MAVDERSLEAVLAQLPSVSGDDLWSSIQRAVHDSAEKIVILDDDPTGTQTAYDVPVLTRWDTDALYAMLRDSTHRAFFVLTNSRSVPPARSEQLHREIAANLLEASAKANVPFEIISRSDSTLRGHFPLETNVLREMMPQPLDGCLLIPFFAEGGRYTIDDVHYVAEANRLIPAASTAFAQDAAFGYKSSNLRDWIAEKSGGFPTAAQVQSISLEEIRAGGIPVVKQRLLTLQGFATCIINAASIKDLLVVVAAILQAKENGKQFLYRTAASFVQARIGLPPRPLLMRDDLGAETNGGGLIIVGSYVPKTTRQLTTLRQSHDISDVELNVQELLSDQDAAVTSAIHTVNECLAKGQDVVLSTSRALVTGDDAAESLQIGNMISQGLVRVVQGLEQRPRYFIAKGGITSSDIATHGLGVVKALVRGQILPGVPVWQLGNESRFPGLPYIIFPGNVGDDDALAQVMNRLATNRAPGE